MKKLIALKFLFLLGILFILPSFNPALASTKIFQDNFDSYPEGTEGLKLNWERIDDPQNRPCDAQWEVKNGEIGISIHQGSCVTNLVPKDNVWNNLGNNYIFDVDMQFVTGTDHNIAFRFVPNTLAGNDWYELHFQSPGDFSLDRSPPGVYNTFIAGNYPNGRTYHIKIIVNDKNVKVFIDGLLVRDFTASTDWFPAGKIALRAGAGGDPNSETYFDNIVVTSIEPPLDVPLLKQTDPAWKDDIYDTADLWNPSDATINTWGCALTSAAMILQYHGFNELPDSTELDPGTLNTWLNNQPDGYIGEGLLNWLALSRLSKLAKEINNITVFDALEYRRVAGADRTQLTTDLDNSQPDILEEPGHFIVAKGINEDTFDINDPYYDRATLNDGYSNSFLSLGRYTPSNTNLSYILLAIDPNVDVLITNTDRQKTGSDGTNSYNEINEGSYYLQPGITDPITGTTSPSIKILMIPTPADGIYTLSVATTSTAVQNFILRIYEYNTEGEVTANTFSAVTKKNKEANYQFTYAQTAETQEDPIDNTKPKMTSAKTLDTDQNGKIDQIELTFNKDINGATVTNADFALDNGYELERTKDAKENIGIVTLFLKENDNNDTGQTPQVTLLKDIDHGVNDFPNGNWNDLQTITPADGASPTTPLATPPGGDYLTNQTVTLTSLDNPNTPTIYYTLDYTDPATSSSRLLYSFPIVINDDLTLKAVAFDQAENKSDLLMQTYGIAPTFEENSISATTSANSFTVAWRTDRPSHSRVIFGTESRQTLGSGSNYGYGKTTNEGKNKVREHSVTITDLTPGATYYYRAISKGSPEQVSEEKSITLPGETASSSSSSTSSSSSSSSSSSTGSTSSASPPVCNDQKPGSAPKITFAFPGVNTVSLHWEEAKDPVSYYLITYGFEPGKPLYGNPDIGGKGTTSFVVQNLSGGKTYYFRVRAGNGCMPGDFSSEVSATPIGFAEEGPATGFAQGVLGTSTPSASPIFVNPTPTLTPSPPFTASFSFKQENILKIGLLIFLVGILTGAYLKLRH